MRRAPLTAPNYKPSKRSGKRERRSGEGRASVACNNLDEWDCSRRCNTLQCCVCVRNVRQGGGIDASGVRDGFSDHQ